MREGGLGEEKSERESTIDLFNTKPHTHFVIAERRPYPPLSIYICLHTLRLREREPTTTVTENQKHCVCLSKTTKKKEKKTLS